MRYREVGVDYHRTRREIAGRPRLLLKLCREGCDVDELLVEINVLILIDRNREVHRILLRGSACFGQIDRQTHQLRQGQGRKHEENEQEEHRIDHRNDLDLRPLELSTPSERHYALTAFACRGLSIAISRERRTLISLVEVCSVSEVARRCLAAK